jgi:hypothetical protein
MRAACVTYAVRRRPTLSLCVHLYIANAGLTERTERTERTGRTGRL